MAETVPVLKVSGLEVSFPSEEGRVTAVRGLDYQVDKGEVMAIVGESGSGKSVSSLAVMGLLPESARVTGSIELNGRQLLGLSDREMSRERGRSVAMISQDPLTALTPIYRIGDQIAEAISVHNPSLSKAKVHDRTLELLDLVGIADPRTRAKSYPHEFSGGMRQRVVIAMAIANDPDLIIADEPTTALDVTTQSDVMALLDELRRERGLAMLFITHDLELAGAVCDRTAVMYAGQIVEEQSADALYADPLHPYTAALVAARPDIDSTAARLAAIPGRPLSAFEAPPGCAFADRCPFAEDRCRGERPALEQFAAGTVRCLRARELRGRLHLAAADV